MVRKPQGSKSHGKYRSRQENVKNGLKKAWVALGREIKIECRILVRKPQGSKSHGKYRSRQENVKNGLKRGVCCWGIETIIAKFVCG